MRYRAAKCRPFAVRDAVAVGTALLLGPILGRAAEGAPWPVPLLPWDRAGSFVENCMDLFYLKALVIYWTLCLISFALVFVRLSRPRPPYRRITRQPGAVACLSATVITVFSSIPPATACLFGTGLTQTTWRECRDELLVPLFLYPCHGYMVAGSWLVLALSGRWRAESSWIDRGGVAVGLAWITSCAIYNVRCTIGP